MLLTDLFHTVNTKEVKIHFASSPDPANNPLHVFWKGDFKRWQEWQNQRNFERPYIFSLIHYSGTNWLFAGMYQQFGKEKVDGHYEYKTELLPINQSLVGRLIVSFPKSFRNSYTNGENYMHEMEVSEILKFPSSFQHFPGYENVKIPFRELKPIIESSESTWKTALQHMNGVYLITDLANGNQYVGSAYGDKAFWNRWTDYISNGHGSNKLLKDVVNQNGLDYVLENYQISILEIMNSNSIWKEVLGTRSFGLNAN